MAGECQERGQPGAGQQVRVVEHGAHLRGAVRQLQLQLQGALSKRADGASDTHIIPVQRVPFPLKAGKPRISWVDPGLRSSQLPALIASGDFEGYPRYHLCREHKRIHHARYKDTYVCAA